MTSYNDLIAVVREKPSELERWLVFGDKLLEDGNHHGEAIANDYNLRKGELKGKEAQQARKSLLNERKKVWKQYAGRGKKISSYFIENDGYWMGSFPLKFPNGKEKLKELDGAFAEEFPNYNLMPQVDTYAQGVHQLRQHCKQETSITHPTFTGADGTTIYRPLTFKENILARVEDFYTLYDENRDKRSMEDRLRLFNTWLNSCTGIAYKANSSKFKIIPQCEQLITIDEDFNKHFLPIDYNSLDGIELDDGREYNELLQPTAVLNHPGWLNAVGNDTALLREYVSLTFAQWKQQYQRDSGMRFWICRNLAEDQLQALFVDSLNSGSSADGNDDLSSSGRCLAK
ncbi:MAG: hypothetical protein Q8R37_03750 [Nanoarchaeota archaeon]|nr:hypothetical protein [Nanoarchaeota archaeon]